MRTSLLTLLKPLSRATTCSKMTYCDSREAYDRAWHQTTVDRDHWSEIRKTPDGARGCVEFDLLCWNLLSQDLIDANRPLYAKCKQPALLWNQRLSLIRNRLSDPRFQIICLQEVNHYHFDRDLDPFMRSLGFQSIYKRRNGAKEDGCAVFFHTSRFELDACKRVDYDQPVFSHDQQRENVGIIARLVPVDRMNRNKLIVATTHLLWNPRRGDIKFSQLRYFMSEVRRMSFSFDRPGHDPVILCGDFNTVPNTPILEFILQGEVNPVGFGRKELSGQEPGRGRTVCKEDLILRGIGMDSSVHDSEETWRENVSCLILDSEKAPVVSHPFNFRSVYRPTKRDGTPYASTKVEGDSFLVDHIFYASSGTLRCLGYRKLMSRDQLNRIGWLPDDVIPSDHLPLEAKFLLTPQF